MPYNKVHPSGWHNAPEQTTPINADALDTIEQGIADAAAAADATTAQLSTITLPDITSSSATPAAVVGSTLTASAANAVVASPALPGTVGAGASLARWAVKNGTTGAITVNYPGSTGSAVSLAVLPDEVLTLRQKSTSGWGVESGNKTLSSLDARFGIVTNVKAFGAKGDGSTDDTSSITAAITAAGTYGTVVFPSGVYVHNATLSPLLGQTWDGQGGATLVAGTSQAGTLSSESRQVSMTVDHATLRNLRFAAPLTAFTSADIEAATVYILNAKHCRVLDCRYETTGVKYAVFVKGTAATDTVIDKNWASGSGFVYCYFGATRTICSNNVSINAPNRAFWGVGNLTTPSTSFPEGCRVTDNTAINAGWSAIEDGSYTRGVFIARNTINVAGSAADSTSSGEGAGISAVGLTPKVVDNNIIDASSTNYAIEVPASGAVVKGNTVGYATVTPGSTSVGIVCQGRSQASTSATGATVSANFIDGAYQAIKVGVATSVAAASVTVQGNAISNPLVKGIAAEQSGAQGVVIDSNTIRFTIPATSGRFGISVTTTQAIQVTNNHLEYTTASAGGAFVDHSILVQSDSSLIGFNTVDAGGRTDSSFTPIIDTNGGTPQFVRLIGNTCVNGARMSLNNMVTPFQFGNRVTSGGIGGVSASTLEFFGSGNSATAKQSVSGSRASNAALASLITALAGMGLITDATTA